MVDSSTHKEGIRISRHKESYAILYYEKVHRVNIVLV
jgi:hypothetical protein